MHINILKNNNLYPETNVLQHFANELFSNKRHHKHFNGKVFNCSNSLKTFFFFKNNHILQEKVYGIEKLLFIVILYYTVLHLFFLIFFLDHFNTIYSNR